MKTSGFTTVEVITVLVLIGILSAVTVATVPRIGESEFAERLLLKSNLRYARQRSMDTTSNWSVSFSGDTYTLNKDGIPGPTFPSGSGSRTVESGLLSAATIEFESPDGTLAGGSLITVTFSGGSSVVVHPTGAIP